MKKVLFYISGHGLGHAAPMTEVVNQITAKAGDVLPIIKTSAPEWLFQQRIKTNFEYVQCECDVGAVQKDWRSVDRLETFKQYSQFIENEPAFIREQLDFIKQNNVGVIVADIPPVAFVVAKQAGVPSFGITNFSWDWIYEPYLAEFGQYKFVVDHIRQCYSQADILLRMPFYGDLSVFGVIEDIPLIAKYSQAEPEQTIANLDIEPGKKLILVYLGNFDHSRVLSDKMLSRNDYFFMTPQTYRKCKLPFADLLKAADAVVTKPGYGIVSECIANQTPIAYTARDDFQEYYALVKGIKKYAHNCFISQQDLFDGRLDEHLDQLFADEFDWPQIATNGAEIAATKILKAISG